MTAAWLEFEQAVAAIASALAPDADVTHNAMIPDVDTGVPRQRDVWIEAKIGGFFPVKVLISCKRYATKINSQHLDAFIGELLSSGAHKGVIYSLVGFTKPALEKAKKKGITCCVLIANQPPPVPDVLVFDAYCLTERVQIRADGTTDPVDWRALLEADGEFEGETMPAYRALARAFNAMATKVQNMPVGQPLLGRTVTHPAASSDHAEAIKLVIQSSWDIYRARTEAWLVNGSYAVTEGAFSGSISSPVIDTWSEHPGPGWEAIDEAQISAGNLFRLIRMQSDIEPALARLAHGDSAPETLLPLPDLPETPDP